MVEVLVTGLRHFDKIGAGHASVNFDLHPEYQLSKTYVQMGEAVGLVWHNLMLSLPTML